MNEVRPSIQKIGTIDCDMVETTPLVFAGRLYRFEYVRENYWNNPTRASYFRFVDVQTGEARAPFARGSHLGSALVDGDGVCAFGVDRWGGDTIRMFRSDDMVSWQTHPALHLPGWKIFNTSVCRAATQYVMAFEIGAPPSETGTPFTIRFATSNDLREWTLTPSACVYSKDRYTACPSLRFVDGIYYMVYLEAEPGPQYVPHIVRSRDLIDWQPSPLNPIMRFSDEDRRIANAALPAELQARIATAVNRNNSDVDFCEFAGEVVILYSWGDQQGTEFLAEARASTSLREFLKGWFPAPASDAASART